MEVALDNNRKEWSWENTLEKNVKMLHVHGNIEDHVLGVDDPSKSFEG